MASGEGFIPEIEAIAAAEAAEEAAPMEIERHTVSLALRSYDGGDLVELDVEADVQGDKVVDIPNSVLGNHFWLSSDWEGALEPLKEAGVKCWYTEWTTEDQEDWPGDYFIDAKTLNRALAEGKLAIEEDPRNPGFFDVKVPKQ